MTQDPSSIDIQARRARPSFRADRRVVRLLWGFLLVLGGSLVWNSISRQDPEVADVWRISLASPDASAGMTSAIRRLDSDRPALLRLEWPAHPNAVEYHLRFRSGTNAAPPPVAVQRPVFLYDLESDVLRLPDRFDWEVAAVLPDGSEVVSPWRSYPSP
jgi:hypothetical protein